MRGKGINYDTGFINKGVSSREPFDIISVDNYRSAEVADIFAAGIRSLVAQGKPVAITEFGCTTYQGAADKGARSGEIIVWDMDAAIPLGLNGENIRDEEEQATYARERNNPS